MKRYYITDRNLAGGVEPLLGIIRRRLAEGIDMIQIREKDMDGRALAELTGHVLGMENRLGTKILVNGRVDVALSTQADGVHLPADSISPARIRTIAPVGFLIGVSCHELKEAERAEAEGADFVVFSPVFPPVSKPTYGPAKGLEALQAVCRAVKIPVFALGGISRDNAGGCLAAGATGVAGVSLFQDDTGADP